MFVHFPIAFYFLELVLVSAWVLKKDESYGRFSRISFFFGYLFMLASLVSGWVAAGGWGHIEGMVRKHFLMALAVFIFYSVRGMHVWLTNSGSWQFRRIQLAGAFMGNILIGYTAYLGGVLVYS